MSLRTIKEWLSASPLERGPCVKRTLNFCDENCGYTASEGYNPREIVIRSIVTRIHDWRSNTTLSGRDIFPSFRVDQPCRRQSSPPKASVSRNPHLAPMLDELEECYHSEDFEKLRCHTPFMLLAVFSKPCMKLLESTFHVHV